MNKELCLRGLVLGLGFWVTALGSSMFVGGNLGADGYTLTCQGIASKLDTSVGLMVSAVGLLLMVVVWLVDKRYIKIGTFISFFVIGPSIDFWTGIFTPMYQYIAPHLPLRLACLGCAIVVVSLGIAIVMSAQLGTHINDTIPVLLSKTCMKRWAFRVSKIVWDVTSVIAGILLGGVFGIGTIMAALCIGPILQMFMPKVRNLVECTVLKAYTTTA